MVDSDVIARVLAVAATRAPRCGAVRVIAVDGGAAAGKSTFALALQAAARAQHRTATVLATDDLLDGWAGQFGYRDRLISQVLAPLAQDEPGNYERFDWYRGCFHGWVPVAVPELLIVEGVGSIAASAGFTSVTVYLDVARAERQRRWVARDGDFQPEWQTWLDAEEQYQATLDLSAVDIIVANAP